MIEKRDRRGRPMEIEERDEEEEERSGDRWGDGQKEKVH